MSYCRYVAGIKDKNNVHVIYHNEHYGFPIEDDNELFGRLILEINQAGLSWDTILKKQDNFRKAYHNFDIKKIAAYRQKDFDRLMQDTGIIRNRLKINAAIHNANVVSGLQKEYGSFLKWIEHNHTETKDEWVKIFKKHFKFTGGEIVNEFLMSIGVLKGAHEDNCLVYKKSIRQKPLHLSKK